MKLPEKYFLYVGNAYPHKNLERLLKAVSSMKYKQSFSSNQVESIKYVFVGGEDYFYKKLKEKVREMDLDNDVIFYGSATREELNLLYKNAIALLFPSLMEGFGLPAVEAMANGCLVLCSDIPVFHEILGNGAVYFNPFNAKDMADKISDVLDNPQKYENLKTQGLELVKKYSWQKLAEETLEIYKNSI